MFLKFPGLLQLQKKHTKLLEKYAKLEEIKNGFRECTALVQQKYEAIEKRNESLIKGNFPACCIVLMLIIVVPLLGFFFVLFHLEMEELLLLLSC